MSKDKKIKLYLSHLVIGVIGIPAAGLMGLFGEYDPLMVSVYLGWVACNVIVVVIVGIWRA